MKQSMERPDLIDAGFTSFLQDWESWKEELAELTIVAKFIPFVYVDLKPMVHYVPASLENVTAVASYVLDKKNRNEMKAIVDSANVWCKRTNTKEQLPRDAISQLEK